MAIPPCRGFWRGTVFVPSVAFLALLRFVAMEVVVNFHRLRNWNGVLIASLPLMAAVIFAQGIRARFVVNGGIHPFIYFIRYLHAW